MTHTDVGPAVCIVNSTAGVRRGRAIEERISVELPDAVIRHTDHGGHATKIARQAVADGYRTVIAVGGDGTLSETANGVLAANRSDSVRLGFVPAGTCNDFVRGRSVASDLRALLDPDRDRKVDVGKVTYRRRSGATASRYFLVNCTVGIVSMIGHTFTEKTAANRILKRLSLPLAEAVSSARVLTGWRPIPLRLSVDGDELRCTATNVAVLKVPFFAGGLSFAGGAAPGDGYLDTVLVDGLGRNGVVNLMWQLFRGRAGDHDAVRRWSTHEVRVESDESRPPLPVEVDGEIVGMTPAVFSVEPARLLTVT
jgi:diacylglycerol kinase (ATP)